MGIAMAWTTRSVLCPGQLRTLWDTLSWLVVSKGLMNSQNTELIAKGAAGRAGTGFPAASEDHEPSLQRCPPRVVFANTEGAQRLGHGSDIGFKSCFYMPRV